MVVGTGLPETGSGIVFGTSISRPSTFTLIFSIAGAAGLFSVVAAVDILFNAKAQRHEGANGFNLFRVVFHRIVNPG
jgi:hypothetical protein